MPKKKVSKKTAKKKVSAETDKFGSRKGSNSAMINLVLSKKPKKMPQLVKEAKVASACYTHLGKLVEAGHVKLSDKGYALA